MKANIENINVSYDHFAENPLADDELVFPVLFHKRYNLINKSSFNIDDFDTWDDLEQELEKEYKYVQKVYMYEHSGIVLSTKPFSCRWDSGVIGFICSNEIEDMHAEVELYSCYLEGECYLIEVNEDIYTIFGYSELIKDLKEIHECSDEEVEKLTKRI